VLDDVRGPLRGPYFSACWVAQLSPALAER
jgi:hypothetical protein